jgi:2-hydroxy-6-oxonona-2,4-dienedioate hydrolase
MKVRGVLAFGLAILAARAPAAAECTADRQTLERGQARPLLICGRAIPRDFRLRGLDGTGITATYRQYLRRCAVDERRPGLYLWLEAADDAASGAVEIIDAATGEAVCEPVDIAVPARLRLPDTELVPSGDDSFRLRVAAPPGIDLSGACESAPSFPPDPMAPQLTAIGPAHCEGGRVTMEVRAIDQQRFAAPVILSGVRSTPGAVPGEAVVHVSLPTPAWSQSMPDRQAKYVDVNGFRTRYFEAGRGEDTLILVHGGQPDPLSPTAQSWRANFAGLARDFHVIAFDNLGHGYTEIPRDAADYEAYYERAAQHLAGLMDTLKLRRVHLVGHSQGGWPVLRVALDQPQRVRCVVSAATVMSLTGDFGKPGSKRFGYSLFVMHPRSGPTVQSLVRMQRFESDSWNNILPAWVARDMPMIQRPELIEARARLVKVGMSPGSPVFRELRRTALDEMQAGGLRDVPHLVLWARQDRLAPMDAGLDFFARASAGGGIVEMHVIDAAGHRFFAERPEASNAAVAGFCGRFRAD